jgi:hypothetical protein
VSVTNGNLEVNGMIITNDLVVRRSTASLATEPTIILPVVNITGIATLGQVCAGQERFGSLEGGKGED